MATTIAFRQSQIKALREGLGLSQEEFAQRLGVSKQSVSQWELEQTKPTVDTITRIVNEFGAKLDSFWAAREGK